MDVFEVEFHVWSITFLCKNGRLSQEKTHQREEVNEQNPYAVATVKRIAGCTDRLRLKVVGHVLIGSM